MCTFNKMVNGEQITVQFYIDDLKVSYNDQSVLEDFLTNLRAKFGQGDKLMENKGLAYKYLGITIDTQFHRKLYSQCLVTLRM